MPNARDALIVAEHLDQVFDGETRLVADGEQVADRQRAVVEHQRQRDRAALADQGHAARGCAADHLVGPQRDAIEEIDDAVAVRAEERQRPARLDQRLRQFSPAACRVLRSPTLKQTKPPAPTCRRRRGDRRHLVAGHGDERRVGRRGQFLDRSEITALGRGSTRRVHAPELARKPQRARACGDRIGPRACRRSARCSADRSSAARAASRSSAQIPSVAMRGPGGFDASDSRGDERCRSRAGPARGNGAEAGSARLAARAAASNSPIATGSA